MKNIDVTSN